MIDFEKLSSGEVSMYNEALAITGLTKRYRDFTLDNVSFSVPHGVVVGFIGENVLGACFCGGIVKFRRDQY